MSIISFYASLVFGFGFGLIVFYRIGRVGLVQFFYWLSGSPPLNIDSNADKELLLDAIGIPSSTTGLLASIFGLGNVNSFITLYSYFLKNIGHRLFYFSTLFGKIFSRLWIILGVPSIILAIIVSRTEDDYFPKWLNDIGITTQMQFFMIILLLYFFAYFIGRLLGSPQRKFNKARIEYERIVASAGYWFDYHNSEKHFYKFKSSLEKINASYSEILSSLNLNHLEMNTQQLMILHYQRALLLATLNDYQGALKALKLSQRLKESLGNSDVWDYNEQLVFESQLLFLQGELVFLVGDKWESRNLFRKSLEIDKSLNDREGISKNMERLEELN